LDSFVATDYPGERLEILVVDGVSSDRTKPIITDFMWKYPFIRLIDNPKGIIPAAMNAGIRNARGQVIIKVDAHSTYPRDYVSRCVKLLDQYGADNVGGVLRILPGEETTMAKAIAFALSHPFGSGNAYIKVGSREPRWADTAAFGCYKREAFDRVGMWNEELAGSSDIDFNVRLRKAGGKILLVPEIQIHYYADPDLRSYWLHNFADGVWATYVIKFGSKAWAWRHWAPPSVCFGFGGISRVEPFLSDIVGIVFRHSGKLRDCQSSSVCTNFCP
jgi:cellulose synthase/poly-beta-1,6-N-acetylglucosamine synthase-like glycosyltransferase